MNTFYFRVPPERKPVLQSSNVRVYSNEKGKTGKRLSQRIQALRSRLHNLFIFGEWRMEDVYAAYFLALFGGIGGFVIYIDATGGITEDFDEVKTPVNMNHSKN